MGDRVSGLMLRVTTIHASSAANTASYYTRYLTAAPGEVPGVWSGRQATALGLSGTVDVEPLELLLSGRDPYRQYRSVASWSIGSPVMVAW